MLTIAAVCLNVGMMKELRGHKQNLHTITRQSSREETIDGRITKWRDDKYERGKSD